MTNGVHKRKRKTYLIQRMLQAKFITIFVLLVIMSSAISGILFYRRTNIELGYNYGEAHSKIKNTGEILLPNLIMGNIIALIVIGCATIALTIFISHKIAGPLHRFEKNAEQIAKGDLTLITKLRQSDQIQGLADSFSKMTYELREKLLGIRKKSEELPGLIDEIKKLSQNEKISSTELTGITARLSKISSGLQESLKNFKL